MRRSRRKRGRRGFTLMEVLLVLVILVILGSLVGVGIRRARQSAFNDAARAQIKMFAQALRGYEMNCLSYPTTADGLGALMEAPSSLKNPTRWRGPYLENVTTLPLDPWDGEYQYELLDADTFRITSAGADGVHGTEDDIAD